MGNVPIHTPSGSAWLRRRITHRIHASARKILWDVCLEINKFEHYLDRNLQSPDDPREAAAWMCISSTVSELELAHERIRLSCHLLEGPTAKDLTLQQLDGLSDELTNFSGHIQSAVTYVYDVVLCHLAGRPPTHRAPAFVTSELVIL